MIAKSSKQKIEEAIINHHNETHIDIDKLTLLDVYNKWLPYKSLHTKSSSYIKRLDVDWRRYYLEDRIIHTPLKDLDFRCLDEWVHRKLRDNEMTKTQYYNMSIILRKGLAFAVDKGWLDNNPFDCVKVNSKMFVKRKKASDHTQVYLKDEQIKVLEEIEKDFN